MKWYVIACIVLVLVVLVGTYLVLQPSASKPTQTATTTPPVSESVESYVREHITQLVTEQPVLGGTWQVTNVSVASSTGTVAYEDGHIARVADFTYHYISGAVYIDSFTAREAPPPPSAKSGIRITALLGPNCPVQRNPSDPACDDKPYQTSLAITTADGSRTIKTVSTDSAGFVAVSLPPGTYDVRGASASILPRCASNGTVTVTSGTYTDVAVSCDTGIR